jgi:hypothetical protein
MIGGSVQILIQAGSCFFPVFFFIRARRPSENNPGMIKWQTVGIEDDKA